MEIATLLLFLFPLAFSPGPGNMLFAANGARFGFRSTLPATVGYHLATFGVTVALGAGAAAAMGTTPEVTLAIQIAGSAYVLWLAWKLWQAGSPDGIEDAKPIGWRDGVILLLLNPKAYVIIALMFSQFISASTNLADVLLISAVFTLNNLTAFTVWTLAGDLLARSFRSESKAHRLNRCMGAMLAAVGVWMLAS